MKNANATASSPAELAAAVINQTISDYTQLCAEGTVPRLNNCLPRCIETLSQLVGFRQLIEWKIGEELEEFVLKSVIQLTSPSRRLTPDEARELIDEVEDRFDPSQNSLPLELTEVKLRIWIQLAIVRQYIPGFSLARFERGELEYQFLHCSAQDD